MFLSHDTECQVEGNNHAWRWGSRTIINISTAPYLMSLMVLLWESYSVFAFTSDTDLMLHVTQIVLQWRGADIGFACD